MVAKNITIEELKENLSYNPQSGEFIRLKNTTREKAGDVSNSQNQMNRRIGKNNKSGHLGVSFYKQTLMWQAYIQVDKKLIHLGFFLSLDDAIKARKSAEQKYNFHPNHGV